MKNNFKSPVTSSNNVTRLNHYANSITSYSSLVEKPVDNYLCNDSGLIFNASGARGDEDEFYSDLYDLHSESVFSEFKYETEGNLVGIYDFIADFILRSDQLGDQGKMLDVGCGKGLLLSKFAKRRPEWDLYAIEPSKNAIPYFNKVMPSIQVFNGNFEDAPFLSDKFDLVTANGVLEHVPDPVAFMKLFRSCISDNGIGFIGVPNFKTNPVDLFTYDHLSRFTPQTIKLIFSLAGFEVVDELASDGRVPMWYVIRPIADQKSISELNPQVDASFQLFSESEAYIQKSFDSINKALSIRRSGEKIAVYGTGAIVLIGTLYTNLEFSDIHCFLDDNNSLWGTKKFNVPVKSPQSLSEENIHYILISANPCYYESILEKIERLTSSNQKVLV